MEVYTDLLELLVPGMVIYVGEDHQSLTIEDTRWKQELLLLKFAAYNDRTAVSELTNELVYVMRSQLPPLEAGAYYYHQMIGLKVYEDSGVYLGVLTEILQTGANDVYLVTDEAGEETLIPAIDEMILTIDRDAGTMTVAKMEWYGEGE